MSYSLSPLPATFVVRLSMISDWHVGCGAGRPGDVDRLVVRDADGLPYVPAKTLTGIWRDACERLALGLDEGVTEGTWSRWVEIVFGGQPARADEEADHSEPPIAALLSVRPAHSPPGLSRVLAGSTPRALAFQSALTFVQPGVKIDSASGRADDEHLRFVEMARGGVELIADCRLSIGPDLDMPATALLIAGAALVERLGGKRRRGAGLCRLQILDARGRAIELGPAIDWLRTNAASVPSPPRLEPSANPPDPIVPPESGGWVTVPLVMELVAPVAVGYRTIGNVMESLDFIPGTYLLPHVTRVLESLGVSARAAIARGDVLVLNGTVCIDGSPGRPAPFCLEVRKNGGSIADPRTIRNVLLEDPVDDEQYKSIRKGYFGPSDGSTMPHYVEVEFVLRTHNTVDEEAQRPSENIGGVYSYEAIAPQQNRTPAVFRSELRLRANLLPKRDGWWKALAADALELGRSKKDDYGRVRLKPEPPELVETERVTHQPDLFVWAVSDVLLRDDFLRPSPHTRELQRQLEMRLGVKLDVVVGKSDTPDTSGKIICSNPKAFVRVRRLESWNVRWGLPRPTLVVLQAGSCARFKVVDGLLDPLRLAAVEAGGLGERVAEGFGQLSFNDPVLCSKLELHPLELQRRDSDREHRLRSGEPGLAAARVLEEQVWRETIRRAALAFAAKDDKVRSYFHWTDRKPPMSQLGALRDAVRSLRDLASAAAIKDGWLRGVQATVNRRDKWPASALQSIDDLLTDPMIVWNEMRAACAQEWYTLTDGAEAEMENKLWALAVRSLVDACVRAHKRRQDEKRARPVGG